MKMIIICLPQATAGQQVTNESIQSMHAPPGGPSRCPPRHPQSSTQPTFTYQEASGAVLSSRHNELKSPSEPQHLSETRNSRLASSHQRSALSTPLHTSPTVHAVLHAWAQKEGSKKLASLRVSVQCSVSCSVILASDSHAQISSLPGASVSATRLR